ncbi:Uncharacterised protein [Mycoplasmopsis synoviae]|uniref:Uncharacterized protein n=1 Tax=Mycoplasmopsis synoviae TaxID=2109 RepID=A0A3B0P8L7_MYCSY|nr:Uncharacterised protein [Mycoplasmopsis synoviae]
MLLVKTTKDHINPKEIKVACLEINIFFLLIGLEKTKISKASDSCSLNKLSALIDA